MDYQEIRKTLDNLSEDGHKKFLSKLIPNISIDNIIGVKSAKIKKLAKELLIQNNALAYIKTDIKDIKLEEVLLKGNLIPKIQSTLEDKLILIDEFLNYLDNWATCDSFVSNLKIFKNYDILNNYRETINTYVRSDKTYVIRYAIVMQLNYYCLYKENLNWIFDNCNYIKDKDYYVHMAIAWCIAKCYIEYPKETLYYLLNSHKLSKITYNQAIQKIVESCQVSKEDKMYLKTLKKTREDS